jgi:uncharacterized membrane protein
MSMTPEERFERIEATLAETAELTRKNAQGLDALVDAHLRIMMTLNRVVDDQASIRESHKDIQASLKRLEETQAKTEETLQAFIRSMQKGGNGHSN